MPTRPITGPLTRSPSGGVTGVGVGGFSPLSVSSLAAWWDSGDLSTLFSDAAGTTPATVNGVVMHQRDKSGNGRNRTQATSANAPILRMRTDGIYYLDYAGGKSLSVPASQGSFNFLHDGSGGTLAAFIEWPQGASDANYLFNGASAAEVGFSTFKSGASETVSMTVYNGTTAAGSGQIARFALSSPAKMLRFQLGPASVTASVDNSEAETETANTASPSTANAARALSVASSFGGKEYAVAIYAKALTKSEARGLYHHFSRYDYATPNVDLTLLLGGQSNMSGRGTVVTTAAEEKLVGVYSYTKAEEFRIATTPEHGLDNRPVATSPDEPTPTSPAHGFALRAGKKLKTDASRNVLLVPCAIGSASIAQWDTPATANDRSTLFGAMVYRYRQASAKGGAPVIVWYGHEGSVGLASPNFSTGGVGTAYQAAWASLVANIRAHCADAPLVFVQLASDDTLATAEAHAAAGEAQRQSELSIPNAYMVVAHDVRRNASPDDIHVSREGMDVIADRVSLAIREHVLGEAVNGTGPRIVSASYAGSTVTLTCDKSLNTTAGNYGNLFRVYVGGVEQTVSSANRGANTSTVEIVCSAPLAGSVTLTYGYRAGPASAARTDFVADSDGLPLPVFGPIVVTP